MGRCKEERPGMFPHPASHSQVTHYGARVAPQRCPILRVSKETITGNAEFSKNKMGRTMDSTTNKPYSKIA